MWIYDAYGQRLIADFQEDRDDPGVLKLQSVTVMETGPLVFPSQLRRTREIDTRLSESGKGRQLTPMTDADQAAYAFPLPRFGEFDILWQRVTTYLNDEGFGTFS